VIAGEVTLVNKLGLHARAASRLVNCASGYAAEIRIVKGSRAVNAKSIMGVLTLAAARGTELVIEAEGADEREALDALVQLVGERFGEDE
jgi:phosphocarrier protein